MSACNCPLPNTGCPFDCRRGCSACEKQACRTRIAALEAENAQLETERERDEARAQVDALTKRASDLIAQVERVADGRHERCLDHEDGMRVEMESLQTEVAALRRKLDEATALLGRAVKYATEDRAVTPGVTRLARLVDEARRFLAGLTSGGKGAA